MKGVRIWHNVYTLGTDDLMERVLIKQRDLLTSCAMEHVKNAKVI